MNDPITNVILYFSIVALVFLAWAFQLWRSRHAPATPALAETEPLPVPVMPKFTCDLDIVVEFQGKKYRVYFAVADVQMVEGE